MTRHPCRWTRGAASLFSALLALTGAAAAAAQPPAPGAPAAGAPAAAPDLSGFKTVETAVQGKITPRAAGTSRLPGYLGIHITADARGRLVIDEVEPESPAARAGLAVGDVVLRAGDRDVKSADELRTLLQLRAAGDKVPLRVTRARKTLNLEATLAATSRPMTSEPSSRLFLGLRTGEPTAEGAPVRLVIMGSPADQAGLKVGDMVVKVEGQAVPDANRLDEMVQAKKAGDAMLFTVKRDGKEMELKVTLAPFRSGDGPGGEGRGEGRGGGGLTIWRKDVYRLGVICISYPDTKPNAQITAKDWEESLFSTGTYTGRNSVTGQPVYGSMNDFFIEQSVGKFRVEGKVFDWVEVKRNRGDYANATGQSRTALLSEALDLVLARDGANALDGYDGLFFLYAGGRFQTNRGGLYWPHRATMTHGGKRYPYFICPEGGSRMADISVFCHEFGHMLGLPDLYARPENPGSEGLGIWCLMSNQAPNGRPQHMSAWCKEQLGWLTPTVIDPSVAQRLILSPINGNTKECFKVLLRPDGSEYLLLENRKKTGFDTSLPAEGLLIWRVVVSRPILEESHGVEGPNGPRAFMDAVPYPSGANNAYTPFTLPSSRPQLGGGYPVHITNIRRLPDGRITFYIGYEFH